MNVNCPKGHSSMTWASFELATFLSQICHLSPFDHHYSHTRAHTHIDCTSKEVNLVWISLLVVGWCCSQSLSLFLMFLTYQLVAVLREVHYLEVFSSPTQAVPDIAESIFSKNDMYRQYVHSLDLIVQWYNKVCMFFCLSFFQRTFDQ